MNLVIQRCETGWQGLQDEALPTECGKESGMNYGPRWASRQVMTARVAPASTPPTAPLTLGR